MEAGIAMNLGNAGGVKASTANGREWETFPTYYGGNRDVTRPNAQQMVFGSERWPKSRMWESHLSGSEGDGAATWIGCPVQFHPGSTPSTRPAFQSRDRGMPASPRRVRSCEKISLLNAASALECGGKRGATPLWLIFKEITARQSAVALRLPAHSKVRLREFAFFHTFVATVDKDHGVSDGQHFQRLVQSRPLQHRASGTVHRAGWVTRIHGKPIECTLGHPLDPESARPSSNESISVGVFGIPAGIRADYNER